MRPLGSAISVYTSKKYLILDCGGLSEYGYVTSVFINGEKLTTNRLLAFQKGCVP
jgi:hypothetical protein